MAGDFSLPSFLFIVEKKADLITLYISFQNILDEINLNYNLKIKLNHGLTFIKAAMGKAVAVRKQNFLERETRIR